MQCNTKQQPDQSHSKQGPASYASAMRPTFPLLVLCAGSLFLLNVAVKADVAVAVAVALVGHLVVVCVAVRALV